MSRYGIDYYGLALYGPDTYVDFSSSLSATPYSYGSIYLKWTSPAGNWSKIRLVRNPYGYPITPFDGITLLDEFYGDDPTELLDSSDLAEGAYYYYSLFVYDINQYVWVKTGQIEGLSVKRFNNQERLWDYLPDVYKLGTVTSYSVTDENSQLKNFLNIFGFWFDQTQTTIELLINRYDVQRVNAKLLPLMLKQFGLEYEEEIGAQQARVLLRDATQLQKEKGSLQGIKEYIKSFSGYSLSNAIEGSALPAVEGLVVGHNLMLDYNDSSFEESLGHWRPYGNLDTFVQHAGTIEIKSIYVDVDGLVHLKVENHDYIPGMRFNVTGCQKPLFNTTLPVYVFSVTETEIRFLKSDPGVYAPSIYPETSEFSGYNTETGKYAKITPYPNPWSELSANPNYPNKQSGTMAILNPLYGPASAVCGDVDNPIDTGVPVKSDETYTFSVYVAKNFGMQRAITCFINWYDRFGNLISTSSGTSVVDSTNDFDGSKRPFVSATSPASAAYAIPGVSIPNIDGYLGQYPEAHYFDAAQFENSPAPTEFDEARALHITLKANRINELPNPNFHGTYVPWKFDGCTTATDPFVSEPKTDTWDVVEAELTSNLVTLTLLKSHHVKVGEDIAVQGVGATYDGVYTVTSKTTKTISYSKTNSDVPNAAVSGTMFHAGSAVKLTSSSSGMSVSSATTSANYCPIYYPGSSYTYSIYFKAYTGTATARASISWYDSAKVLISTTDGDWTTAETVWNRAGVTSAAPSSAAYASVNLTINSNAGDEVAIFGALFERGAFVLDYFDGDAEAETVSAEDVFWEGGISGAGRSHYYRNRVATMYRLKATLPGYLTAGSTFAFYLAQPNT